MILEGDDYLDQLFVAPDYQGNGLGRRLLGFTRDHLPDGELHWPAGAALSWAGECWAVQAELTHQAVTRTSEVMRELLARTGDYGCPGAQAAERWPVRP